MWGSATLTMVASSTTISWAVAMTTSARPRRRLPGPAPAVPVTDRPVRGCADDMASSLLKAVLNPRRGGDSFAAHGSFDWWREGAATGGSCARPDSGCRRKALAPLAVRAGGRRADQDLAHLLPVLGGPVVGFMAGRVACLDGREELADEAEQAGALVVVERVPPGQTVQDLVLDPLFQFQPGRGEGDPLDPPVGRVTLAGRQSSLLQLVGDVGDERRVAAHPLSQFAISTLRVQTCTYFRSSIVEWINHKQAYLRESTLYRVNS